MHQCFICEMKPARKPSRPCCRRISSSARLSRMGPYKELANAESLHSHRNKTKKLTVDRAKAVQNQQARFADAGETSEQRYARIKKEEKAKAAKAFLANTDYSHYEEHAVAVKDEGQKETPET